MTVASAFALFASQDYQVCIRPDLALSRQVACSSATTRKPSVLAQTLHSLGQITNPRITAQEVRAHCDDPWNELADRLAKWTVANSKEIGQVAWLPIHALACSASDRAWGWLSTAPEPFQTTLPKLHGGGVWQPPPSDHVITTKTKDSFDTCNMNSVHFQVATYNALALDAAEEFQRLPGPRSIRVDRQFHDHKVAFVGMQETRTAEGQRCTDHYRIFSSGFSQCGRARHHGCELWVHRSLPIGRLEDGTAVTASDLTFTVLASDPRYLLVRLQGPLQVYFLVAHAPCLCADRPLDLVQTWWQNLEQVLSKVPTQALLLCCIDANAPLADKTTKYFDIHQAEAVNGPGHVFQDFLTTQALYVPSSFSWHVGPGATWRHPNGQLLRRDYVAVSERVFSMVSASQVLTDFDSGFGHQDHFPAQLTIQGFVPTAAPPTKMRWDFAKLGDPLARKAFENALLTLPLPTWQVDVDAHASILETNILQLAQQHFGAPPRTRQRPVLSHTTLNGIALKRQALQLLRSEGMSRDPLLLAELKQFEQLLRPMVLHDQQQWYASWLDGIDTAARRCDTAQVYKKLIRLGRKRTTHNQGPRPLPKLVAQDGSVA